MAACKKCSQNFTVKPEDKAFYQRIEVPEPTLCSDCRWQRRLVLRNERTLYDDKCDLCKKSIISLYSEDKPYKVYCYDCFHSDKWDRLQYGRDFDFKRPFFEQFKELQLEVPRIHAFATNNENSEYTNGSAYNKNCYMIFVSDHNEDCLFSYSIFECTNCVDCFNSYKCEVSYECSGCFNCYGSKYLADCSDCVESQHCVDCKGCSNCFGCVGLRNKEYYFLNKPLSKDEYNKKIKNISKKDFEDFEQLKLNHKYLYMHGLNNENSAGDYINRCKDCADCYDSHDLEKCKYIIHGNKCKDTYDGYMIGDDTELSYETVGSLSCNDCQFNYFIINAHNVEYCDACFGVKNLFGCIGLKKAEYCILNKQYSDKDFQDLKNKIVEHMKKTDEYGEFFPLENSPFEYWETAANEYYPQNKNAEGEKPVSRLHPICKQCGKNYNFVKQEEKFYEDNNIDKPDKCFNCRHENRLKQKNPRQLWDRKCAKCQADIKTSYYPKRPEQVYCRKCYNEYMY